MAKNAAMEDDLLATMDGDLLNEIEEDESEAWVPDGPGDGIQGVVYKTGTTRSEFHQGDEALRPTVWLKTKDGDKFRVIGYSGVLKNELVNNDPKVGDLIAVKYFGTKKVKKGRWAGKDYHHYGVVVKRAES